MEEEPSELADQDGINHPRTSGRAEDNWFSFYATMEPASPPPEPLAPTMLSPSRVALLPTCEESGGAGAPLGVRVRRRRSYDRAGPLFSSHHRVAALLVALLPSVCEALSGACRKDFDDVNVDQTRRINCERSLRRSRAKKGSPFILQKATSKTCNAAPNFFDSGPDGS